MVELAPCVQKRPLGPAELVGLPARLQAAGEDAQAWSPQFPGAQKGQARLQTLPKRFDWFGGSGLPENEEPTGHGRAWGPQ